MDDVDVMHIFERVVSGIETALSLSQEPYHRKQAAGTYTQVFRDLSDVLITEGVQSAGVFRELDKRFSLGSLLELCALKSEFDRVCSEAGYKSFLIDSKYGFMKSAAVIIPIEERWAHMKRTYGKVDIK
ncbi:MAG: hypothetical protein H6868_08445 [Rhodospirillales bacterium]|nr:hypothetical protein [Rhodospirillales bacterium]